MDASTDKAKPTFWFDAVLHPHRSLSPHGFMWLMGLLSLLALSLGLRFYFIGAWPVFAFLGLDVLGLYIAFKINYRRARLFETVQLTDEALTVRRVAPGGESKEWTFIPSWVRIKMDNPPAWQSQLTLSSHGNSLQIGSFLTPEERLGVAQVLNDALRRQQSGLAALKARAPVPCHSDPAPGLWPKWRP